MTNKVKAAAKANVGFSGYSDPNFLALFLAVLAGLANKIFVNPPVTLVDLQVAGDDFTAKLKDASSRSKDDVKAKNNSRDALEDVMKKLGNWVTTVANGDRSVVELSNFKARKVSAPRAPIQKPENIQASKGTNTGDVVVSIDPVKNKVTYCYGYRVSGDEKSAWTEIYFSRKEYMIKSLTKGVNYDFRVAALGIEEQVVYSDIVSLIAQ